MMIITENLLLRAIELARPTAEMILLQTDCNWGPTWVDGRINAPGVADSVPFTFGVVSEWQESWGEKREPFDNIAVQKTNLGSRIGLDTSLIAAAYPWLIEDDEYLYPGCATRCGISVGTSGARGRADEAISNVVIDCIIMLAYLETDRRVGQHEMRI